MYKKNGIWYANFRVNGKRVQKCLETPNQKLAQKIEAKLRCDLAESKHFGNKLSRNLKVKEMLEKLMSEHAPSVSDSTRTSYSYSLKNILPFFGELLIEDVSRREVSNYKTLRKKEGVSTATINRELALLSKAFNLALHEWHWTHKNPLRGVFEKEDNEVDRWLTLEEEYLLLEKSPEWLQDFVKFAIYSGMRRGEILRLEWSWINTTLDVVTIPKNVTKNGEPRAVPLPLPAKAVLEKRSKYSSFESTGVFLTDSGAKIDPRNLKRVLDRAIKRSGIKHVRVHDLRHTFASRLAQKGIDQFSISRLLGHKDTRMTQRYSHHSIESLKQGVEALNV